MNKANWESKTERHRPEMYGRGVSSVSKTFSPNRPCLFLYRETARAKGQHWNVGVMYCFFRLLYNKIIV